jgi:hypothetical protein
MAIKKCQRLVGLLIPFDSDIMWVSLDMHFLALLTILAQCFTCIALAHLVFPGKAHTLPHNSYDIDPAAEPFFQ